MKYLKLLVELRGFSVEVGGDVLPKLPELEFGLDHLGFALCAQKQNPQAEVPAELLPKPPKGLAPRAEVRVDVLPKLPKGVSAVLAVSEPIHSTKTEPPRARYITELQAFGWIHHATWTVSDICEKHPHAAGQIAGLMREYHPHIANLYSDGDYAALRSCIDEYIEAVELAAHGEEHKK